MLEVSDVRTVGNHESTAGDYNDKSVGAESNNQCSIEQSAGSSPDPVVSGDSSELSILVLSTRSLEKTGNLQEGNISPRSLRVRRVRAASAKLSSPSKVIRETINVQLDEKVASHPSTHSKDTASIKQESEVTIELDSIVNGDAVPHQDRSSSKTVEVINVQTQSHSKADKTGSAIPKKRVRKRTPRNNKKACMIVKCAQQTQTEDRNSDNKIAIIDSLNTDDKLQALTGIPSLEVLDYLTDATLKMVMNNQALISNLGPCFREWIILTCCKFELNLSAKALAVLFDIEEEKCLQIIPKTSQFLRKSLALPSCQMFICNLSMSVLNGIADNTDAMINT